MEDVGKEIPLLLDDSIPFIGSFLPYSASSIVRPLCQRRENRGIGSCLNLCAILRSVIWLSGGMKVAAVHRMED